MTKSPVSRCGANVGLCLPRNSVAAEDAKRPSTTSAASIPCHLRSISFGFGLYVRTGLPCLVVGVGTLPGAAAREGAGARNTSLPARGETPDLTPEPAQRARRAFAQQRITILGVPTGGQ